MVLWPDPERSWESIVPELGGDKIGLLAVVIELSPEREAALRPQAEAHGLSVQDWLLRLAEQQPDQESGAEPFWKIFTETIHTLPPEVFDDLPVDGASEHDHYLYGSPKRNT